MPYSVVLIDDESWALAGINRSFSWEKFGFQVVLQETSAQRALKYILENKPDAVFTDIRMNHMTGIDLIREARQAGLDTEFVIISGYSDFQYAQSAIQHGVFQYLLKPLDIAETDDVLLALSRRLGEKRPALSPFDWVDMLQSRNESFRSYCLRQNLVPCHDTFYILTVTGAALPVEWFSQVRLQILENIPFGSHICVAILCADGSLQELIPATESGVAVGVSTPAKADDPMHQKYRESDIACSQLLFSNSVGFFFYRRNTSKSAAQASARLISILAAGTSDDIASAMDELIRESAAQPLTVEDLALLHNQILTGLQANKQYVFSAGLDPLSYRSVTTLFHSTEDFYQYLRDLVNPSHFDPSPDDEKNHQLMTEIQEYIRANYASPLYLSDLSRHFYLSQTTLCELFRRNLKTSFMSFLTEIRIGKAAELLSNTRMTLTEISENVGYRDQYYFSRTFKKQTGLTPQQFRKLNSVIKGGD